MGRRLTEAVVPALRTQVVRHVKKVLSVISLPARLSSILSSGLVVFLALVCGLLLPVAAMAGQVRGHVLALETDDPSSHVEADGGQRPVLQHRHHVSAQLRGRGAARGARGS
jgi:hypothetical protein